MVSTFGSFVGQDTQPQFERSPILNYDLSKHGLIEQKLPENNKYNRESIYFLIFIVVVGILVFIFIFLLIRASDGSKEGENCFHVNDCVANHYCGGDNRCHQGSRNIKKG